MLVKNLIREHIGAVAGYNSKAVRKADGEVIQTNLASSSAHGIEQEMGAVAALRPRVIKPGVHSVIAMHPDDKEKVTNQMLVEIVKEFRQRMGLEQAQTVVWRHHDTAHPHVHCLLNRVTVDNKVVSMWNLKRKVQAFESDMCRKYGLRKLLEEEFDEVHPELECRRQACQSIGV